jgi:hypothetical protein
MNTIHHINNQAELEQLINRYFDGETTVQEEQMLRENLANCSWNSEVIDEARFTLGYFAAHSNQQQSVAKKNRRRQVIGIAASIAIILGVGSVVLWHQQQVNDNMCIACVNGEIINNDDAIMALIANDLNTMDDASQSMEAQLASIGEALELDN